VTLPNQIACCPSSSSIIISNPSIFQVNFVTIIYISYIVQSCIINYRAIASLKGSMFIHYIHTNRKAAMVAVVSIKVHFILPATTAILRYLSVWQFRKTGFSLRNQGGCFVKRFRYEMVIPFRLPIGPVFPKCEIGIPFRFRISFTVRIGLIPDRPSCRYVQSVDCL
jgi:hypothetical protein